MGTFSVGKNVTATSLVKCWIKLKLYPQCAERSVDLGSTVVPTYKNEMYVEQTKNTVGSYSKAYASANNSRDHAL
jgi:hypothetical protein